MKEEREEEFLSLEIKKLDKEIKELEKEKKKVEEEIKRLIRKEDIRAGRIYARDIFELQQKKLSLGIEIDIRKKRKIRLTWETTSIPN